MIQEINFITDPIVTHVWFSLHNHCYDEALFCAERLYAETNHEESLFLLATCYFAKNLYKQACTLLKVKGCAFPKTKFLLARCYWELDELVEAEIALLGTPFPYNNVPLEEVVREYGDQAAYVLLLLGDIYRYQNHEQRAQECYELCLRVNPLMWTAFERLCDLCPNTNNLSGGDENYFAPLSAEKIASSNASRWTVDPAAVFQVPANCDLTVATLHVPTQSVFSTVLGPDSRQGNCGSAASRPGSAPIVTTSNGASIGHQPPREVLSSHNRSNMAVTTVGANERGSDANLEPRGTSVTVMETSSVGPGTTDLWNSGAAVASVTSPSHQSLYVEHDNIFSRENQNPFEPGSGNMSRQAFNATSADSELGTSSSSSVTTSDSGMDSTPYAIQIPAPNLSSALLYDSAVRTPEQPPPSSRGPLLGAPKATSVSRPGGHYPPWPRYRGGLVRGSQTCSRIPSSTAMHSRGGPESKVTNAFQSPSTLQGPPNLASPSIPPPTFGMLGLHLHSPMFAAVPVFNTPSPITGDLMRRSFAATAVSSGTPPNTPTTSTVFTRSGTTDPDAVSVPTGLTTPPSTPPGPSTSNCPVGGSGARQLRSSARRHHNVMFMGQQSHYSSGASDGSSSPSRISSLRFPLSSSATGSGVGNRGLMGPGNHQGNVGSKENGSPLGATGPRTRLQVARAAMMSSTSTSVHPSGAAPQQQTSQQQPATSSYLASSLEGDQYPVTSRVEDNLHPSSLYSSVELGSRKPAQTTTTNTTTGDTTCEQQVLQETHRQRYQSLENYLGLLRHMGEAYCLLTRFQLSTARQYLLRHLPYSQLHSSLITTWTARTWIEEDEHDRACVLLRELHLREPWQTRGMDDYSIVLWNLNREVELSSLANDMLRLDRRFSAIPWVVAGNCMSLHRDRHIAIKYFKRAIDVNPHYALAFRLLGHEHKLEEELEKARSAYHESLRLDSRQYRTYLALSQVFYCQDQYALAQHPLMQALHLHPNSAFLLTHLGIIRANLGIYSGPDGALACLERACQLQQKPSMLSRFNLARVLIKLGHLNRALEALHELRQLAPKEATILYYISDVYKMLGKLPQHMTYLSWAKEMDPKHAGGNILNDALQPRFSMAGTQHSINEEDDSGSNVADTTLSGGETPFLVPEMATAMESEMPRSADPHSPSPSLFAVQPPPTEGDEEDEDESSGLWPLDMS